MAGDESSDNIGSLSVDVEVRDQATEKLGQIKALLTELASKETVLRVTLPDNVAARLEQLQGTKVSGTAAPTGGGAAMTRMAFSEQDASHVAGQLAGKLRYALQMALRDLHVTIKIDNLHELQQTLGQNVHIEHQAGAAATAGSPAPMAQAQTNTERDHALRALRTKIESTESAAGGIIEGVTEINRKFKAAGRQTIRVFDDVAEQYVALLDTLGAASSVDLATTKTGKRVKPMVTGGLLHGVADSDPNFVQAVARLIASTSTLNSNVAQVRATGAPQPVRVVNPQPAAAATPAAEPTAPPVQRARQEQAAPAREPGKTYATAAELPLTSIRGLIDDSLRRSTPIQRATQQRAGFWYDELGNRHEENQGAAGRGGPRTTAREIGESAGTADVFGPKPAGTRRVRKGEYQDFKGVLGNRIRRTRYTDQSVPQSRDPLVSEDYEVLGGRNPYLVGDITYKGTDYKPIARDILRGAFEGYAEGVDNPGVLAKMGKDDEGRYQLEGREVGVLAGREKQGQFRGVSPQTLVYRALKEMGMDEADAQRATNKGGVFRRLLQVRGRAVQLPRGVEQGFGGGTRTVESGARDIVRGMALLRGRQRDVAAQDARIAFLQEAGVEGQDTDKLGRPIRPKPGRLYFTSEELKQEAIDSAKHARQMAHEKLQQAESRARKNQLRFVSDAVGSRDNQDRVAGGVGRPGKGAMVAGTALRGPTKSGAPLETERTFLPDEYAKIEEGRGAQGTLEERGINWEKGIQDIFDDLMSGNLPTERRGEKTPPFWVMPDAPQGRYLSEEEWEKVRLHPEGGRQPLPPFTAAAALQQRVADYMDSLYDELGMTGKQRTTGALERAGLYGPAALPSAAFGTFRTYQQFADQRRDARRQDTRATGVPVAAGTRQDPRHRVYPDTDVVTEYNPELVAQRDAALRERDEIEKKHGVVRRQIGLNVNKGSVSGTYELPDFPEQPLQGPAPSGETLEASIRGEVMAANRRLRAVEAEILRTQRRYRRTTLGRERAPEDEILAGPTPTGDLLRVPRYIDKAARNLTGGDAEREAGADILPPPGQRPPQTVIDQIRMRDLRERVAGAAGGGGGSSLPPTQADGGPMGSGPLHVIIDAPLPIPVVMEGGGFVAQGGAPVDPRARFRSQALGARLNVAGLRPEEGERNAGMILRMGREAVQAGWSADAIRKNFSSEYNPGVGDQLVAQLTKEGLLPEAGGGAAAAGGGGGGKRPKNLQYGNQPYGTGAWNLQRVDQAPPRVVDYEAQIRRSARNIPPPGFAEWMSANPAMRDVSRMGIQFPQAGIDRQRSQAAMAAVRAADREKARAEAEAERERKRQEREELRGIGGSRALSAIRGAQVGDVGDLQSAELAASLRRQQGQLGQRAFGPTIVSAVQNMLAGQPMFNRPRVLDLPTEPIKPPPGYAGPQLASLAELLGKRDEDGNLIGTQFTLPGDPFSRINLARREEGEANTLYGQQQAQQRRVTGLERQRVQLNDRLMGQRASGASANVIEGTTKKLAGLDQELGTARTRLGELTKATIEQTAGAKFLADNASGAADVLGNLAQGFVGGMAAGLVAPLAMAAGPAIVGIVKSIFGPAYEAAIGYQNVTNQVVSSLSDQVRATQGATKQTVALSAAQAGISAATYDRIGPGLEQAAGVEAGNKAFADMMAMIRAGEGVNGQVAPRGVYQNTGGLNILGYQTPIGGTPSTIENTLNAFNGVWRGTNGIAGGMVAHNDIPSQILDKAGWLLGGGLVDKLGLPGFAGDAWRAQQTQSDALADTRVKDMNDLMAKMPSGYTFARDYDQAGLDKIEQAMRIGGVDPQVITDWKALGLTIHDSTGAVVTDIASINKALIELGQAPAMQDPKQWAQSLTGARGELTNQVLTMGLNAQLGRASMFSNWGLQNVANPPMRIGEEIPPGLAPAAFTQGYVSKTDSGSAAMQLMNDQLQAQANAITQQRLANLINPADQQAAQSLLGTVTALGQQIHGYNVEISHIQMAQQFRAANHELSLMNRALGEAAGLANMPGASDLGIMERKQLDLSRLMTTQQLDHSQQSLNYQKALAGFLAPGATGEEIATRVRIAEKETKFQQTQLNENREMNTLGNAIQDEKNIQGYKDLLYSRNEFIRQLNDQGAINALTDKLNKAQSNEQLAMGMLDSYMQQSDQVAQLSISILAQEVKMGATVFDATVSAAETLGQVYTDLATLYQSLGGTPPALDAANPDRPDETGKPFNWTDIGGSADVGPDQLPPEFFPPGESPGSKPRSYIPFFGTDPNIAGGGAGLIDPYAYLPSKAPAQVNNGQTVVINNPSAGVDTVALTRTVINELNRQGSLRNSPLG